MTAGVRCLVHVACGSLPGAPDNYGFWCNANLHTFRADGGLWIVACGSWPAVRGLWIVACGSWPADRGLRIVAGGSWPADRGLRIVAGGSWPADRGPRIVACGLWPADRGRRIVAGGSWPSFGCGYFTFTKTLYAFFTFSMPN